MKSKKKKKEEVNSGMADIKYWRAKLPCGNLHSHVTNKPPKPQF